MAEPVARTRTLREVIVQGDFWGVCELVSLGDDVNEPDRVGGWTALHWAASAGNLEIVRFLVGRGASINILDAAGETPLHQAAREGHKDAALALLLAGARADTPPHHPAHAGVKKKDLRLLLEAAHCGAPPGFLQCLAGGNVRALKSALQQHAPVGCSCLVHQSVRAGFTDLALYLVAHGADIGVLDSENATPLSIAARTGNLSVTEALLARGAATQTADSYGMTPVHHAACAGSEAVLRVLLEAGGDSGAVDAFGRQPLHYAAQRGALGCVQLLVQRPVPPGLNCVDYEHRTPAWCAAASGHNLVVRCLQERGADLLVADSTGMTPLAQAVFNGHLLPLEALLENGGWEVGDHLRRTVLHHAAMLGHTEICRWLVDAVRSRSTRSAFVAWLDQPDVLRCTALHHAAANGRGAVGILLAANGASLRARNSDGLAPAQVARSPELVRALVAAAASASAAATPATPASPGIVAAEVSGAAGGVLPSQQALLARGGRSTTAGTAGAAWNVLPQVPASVLARVPDAPAPASLLLLGGGRARQRTRRKFAFRVLVMGDPGVGKTAVIGRFLSAGFLASAAVTGAGAGAGEAAGGAGGVLAAVPAAVRQVVLGSENAIVTVRAVEIGAASAASLRAADIEGADGCVFVFDASQAASFSNIDTWRDALLFRGGAGARSLPAVLMGNKCDLRSAGGGGGVAAQRAEAWCVSRSEHPAAVRYFETGLGDATAVLEAFECLARQMYGMQGERGAAAGSAAQGGDLDSAAPSGDGACTLV